MNKKRTWYEKVGDFISGKGFYLVVLVCVAAIALSGFYLVQGVRGNLAGSLDDQPVAGSAQITETQKPSPTPSVQPSVQPSAQPSASPKPTVTPEPTVTPNPTAPTTTPASLVFTWPVKGTVIAGFSVEALAYDETMGDWRTHDGMDIGATLGTQVMAAANGTISALYQDDLMGTTVVIDHGSGLTSVYSNLAEVPTVAVGDQVSTGDILGSVGNTAVAESGRDSHLHFAMYQDNTAIDPTAYLP